MQVTSLSTSAFAQLSPWLTSLPATKTMVSAASSQETMEFGSAAGLSSEDSSILETLSAGSPDRPQQIDYAAVATGSDVTPQYAGGDSVIGIVSNWGTVMYYGGSVQSGPNSSSSGGCGTASARTAKAMTITFAPGTTPAEQQELTSSSLSFFYEHLGDSQNASGQWSRPTFDIVAG